MNVTLRRLGIAVLLLVAIGVLPACSSQEPPVAEPTTGETAPAPRETTPPPTPTEPPEAGEWEAAEPAGDVLTPDELNRMGVLRTIYFDYDRSEIRPDQRPVLQQNAQWLRQNAAYRILVEGHCDERGTREYNLALGNRRATATRDYLVSLGVPENRIEIISYGEEQPAVEGSDEQAWEMNRRSEFKVVAVTS